MIHITGIMGLLSIQESLPATHMALTGGAVCLVGYLRRRPFTNSFISRTTFTAGFQCLRDNRPKRRRISVQHERQKRFQTAFVCAFFIVELFLPDRSHSRPTWTNQTRMCPEILENGSHYIWWSSYFVLSVYCTDLIVPWCVGKPLVWLWLVSWH
jgi:hypothetical protein